MAWLAALVPKPRVNPGSSPGQALDRFDYQIEAADINSSILADVEQSPLPYLPHITLHN